MPATGLQAVTTRASTTEVHHPRRVGPHPRAGRPQASITPWIQSERTRHDGCGWPEKLEAIWNF